MIISSWRYHFNENEIDFLAALLFGLVPVRQHLFRLDDPEVSLEENVRGREGEGREGERGEREGRREEGGREVGRSD
jgi:hypothetical protein